jgi:signal peptidase I
MMDDEKRAAPEAPAEEIKPRGGRRAMKEIREWVVSLAVALLVVFVLRSFVFTIIRVDGASMQTTLYNNERLFVSVFDVKLWGPSRGDVVICNYPERYTTHILGIQTKTYFVKRVVAVPGDTVSRAGGVTSVTNFETGETAALDAQFPNRYRGNDYTYILQPGEYFVVGDNRGNSHDSRDWNDSDPSEDVGPVTADMIVGKVRSVIWPLSDIRGID